MKRTLMLIFATLLVAATASAQPPQGAQKPADAPKADASMPTVDQILDKYVQALGGKAAIEKLTSRMSKGSFDIPAMGASGTAEIYEKAPNKTLAIITIPGFGVIQEGFNGATAWTQDPQSGLREKTGQELADAKLDADFHKPIRIKQLYPKLELKGKEKFGAGEAYIVMATPAEGSVEKWYFDTQSGLLVRADSERESPMGKVPIETYMENYKDVDGVKMAHTVRITNPSFSINITIQEVKQNIPIEDTKFNKPAAQ
jgi:zinc protease